MDRRAAEGGRHASQLTEGRHRYRGSPGFPAETLLYRAVVEQSPNPKRVFLVERYLPGVTEVDLSMAVRATTRVASLLSDGSVDVRHLVCTLIPVEEVVLCLFQAPSADAVAEVNQRADMPFERIVSALAVDIPVLGRPGFATPEGVRLGERR